MRTGEGRWTGRWPRRAVVGLVGGASIAALLSACASTAPDRDPSVSEVAQLNVALCPVLARQAGSEAVTQTAARLGWSPIEALATASCSYDFVDGGAPSPAGHHIVARYGNHELIGWIAETYGVDAATRVFRRTGRDGDAMDYLDATIAFFKEPDPAIATIFEGARADLEAALSGAAIPSLKNGS